MSSINEIDPRLRDTSTNTYPPNISTPSSITTVFSPSAQQYPSPQLGIYPNAPQSAGHATDPGLAEAEGHDGGPDDAKRPRACESCRGLKVRCDTDPNNVDGPCMRCAKAHRNCVVTVPSRKRQKKTDSRVAELEKKIDALTASLHASKSAPLPLMRDNEIRMEESMSMQNRPNPYQQVTNGGYGSSSASHPEPRMTSEWAGYSKPPEYEMRTSTAPPMVVAGQRRKYAESREYPATYGSQSPATRAPDRKPAIGGLASRQDAPSSLLAPQPWQQKPPATHEYADAIDRGLVTAEMATDMFNYFVERMSPHMPAIAFPSGTTAADVRKSKPILFLAILSASSGLSHPAVQKVLSKEVMSIYADRIICNGEKNLEIIQALQVSALWYWPPEHFEELKFYQLIHIAAVMAIDVGMGKRSKSSMNKTAGLLRDHVWRRTPYPDPESIEARRTWLSCYFLCCTASMGLRRPNLIRWTPFMADCLDVLERSPDAAPSDRSLCQWVRSQHIAEEIGTQFSMDDPVANVSISDAKVQHALKGFERDLEKWRSQIPPEVNSTTLRMTGHVINLYMHEVAMHVDHNIDEFKPPFTEDGLRNVGQGEYLTSTHISALSSCLASIDGIFDCFLTFDVDTIRCLPVGHFVRVAYAVVVLIKMYFAAAAPNSELGKVINKDDIKVDQYLDRLIDIFKASAAEEKSRLAAKFLMVLIMLRTWFLRQKEGKPSGEQSELGVFSASIATAGPSTRTAGDTTLTRSSSSDSANLGAQQNMQQIPGQLQGYSPANTPLQLLSEVATGNSRGQSRSGNGSYSTPSNDWQQQQQPFASYDPLANTQHQPFMPGHSNMNMGGNVDLSLGMDFRYSMGDGFEHAMGMTLGMGDFGETYFNDDALFNNLMGSVMGQGGTTFEGS